ARAASSRASSPLARAPGNAACRALRASGLAAGSSVVPISLAPKITRAPLASESNQPRIIATMKNARAMVEMRYADSRVVVAIRLKLRELKAPTGSVDALSRPYHAWPVTNHVTQDMTQSAAGGPPGRELRLQHAREAGRELVGEQRLFH